MKTVLIAMTIMGCDDTVTQCEYVATVDRTYETIAQCDGAIEGQLTRVTNSNFPTLVAICEAPRQEVATAATDDVSDASSNTDHATAASNKAPVIVDAGQMVVPPRPSVDVAPSGQGSAELAPLELSPVELGPVELGKPDKPSFSKRVLTAIRSALPNRNAVREAANRPVRNITEFYSYVVKRLENKAGDEAH